MFDALCHVTPGSLSSMSKHGVTAVMQGGFCPRTWSSQLTESPSSITLLRSCGIHPWAVGDTLDADLLRFEEALQRGEHAAVGEVGLDKLRSTAPLTLQAEALLAQLGTAKKHGLPVILHVVRAHGMALDMLAECRGMVHGFTGAPEVARAYLRRGLHISFGHGMLRQNARRARAAAAIVPLDRLLVETDGLPPEECENGLHAVLLALSALRPEPVEELAAVTADNARRLFIKGG